MTAMASQTGDAGHHRDDVWTVKRILDFSVGYLKERGFDAPRVDAEYLLGHVLKVKRIELYTGFDKPLTAEERGRFRELLRRRVQGEPIAYIMGERDFYGRTFQVSSAVLIPRPETELIVEQLLAQVGVAERPLRVLDVGTGSGALAISVSLALPQAEVEAWDISPEALVVAQANQERLGSRVLFREVDAQHAESWQSAIPFDYILSNPPYIAEQEIPLMGPGVLAFEPRKALIAGENGLAFYHCFARHAHRILAPHGKIILEHGFTQAQAVAEAFAGPAWAGHVSVKDLAGHPRVFVASRV